MTVFDQNIALASVARNLIPGKDLIDGRTQKDDIVFIAEFSRLINFFEENNTRKGSWQPFVLKDPAFLLAIISRYPYNKYHDTYLNERKTLDALLNENKWTEKTPHLIEQHLAITFDLLLSVFEDLAGWVVFMLMPDHHYDLRNYIIRQIKEQFGTTVWSLIVLVNAASELLHSAGLQPVPDSFSSQFPDFPWQQNPAAIIDIDIRPDRLHTLLKNEKENWAPRQENYQKLYDPLCKVGDPLFAFIKKITDHADIEYHSEIAKKTPFPDTLLLRAFADAMTVQRAAINNIPDRHLDFYYRDILKQKPMPGIPDSVYLALTTGSGIPVSVPKGTLFNGGTENDQPILFSANDATLINPAIVSTAYTLFKIRNQPATDTRPSELLNLSVHATGKIASNPDGTIAGWRCFGDDSATETGINELVFSMVFASPILLLREGTRIVTITLTLADSAYFRPPSAIYLSTATSWLQVTNTNTTSPLSIEFTLTPDQEGIVPYPKNPEGISSEWPLLKLDFAKTVDWSRPPILTKLDIAVNVSNLNSSVLYNDYGPAGGKLPFQLFGPTPMPGAAFTFGNNEVFTKPVDYLNFNLSWNNLPPTSFSQYYSSYNNYLANSGDKPDVQYSYNSFLATFTMLNNGNWVPPHSKTQPAPPSLLFVPLPSESSEQEQYDTQTSYTFEAPAGTHLFQPCPQLQTTTYTLSPLSTSGFMRITLDGTPWGFGSTLYPKVVSYVTLNKVKELLPRHHHNQPKDTDKKPGVIKRIAAGIKQFLLGSNEKHSHKEEDLLMPNAPFAPSISKFEVINYKANTSYSFANNTANEPFPAYPIECYQVSAAGNSLVYQNDSFVPTPSLLPGSTSENQHGLQLFPSIPYSGYMLISLDHLAAPADLSLYFELTGATSAIPAKEAITCFCKTKDNWQKLDIINDSTSALSRSGIITISVPANIIATKWLGAETPKYWIAITTNNNISCYGKVSFLSANGVYATQLPNELQYETGIPVVPAGSINKMQLGIPGITSVIQPFPSFGGIQPETKSDMNQRVAQRILTKDRAVSAVDYFRLIRQRFENVYYLSTGYRSASNITYVWVIKQFHGPEDPGAYKPAFENTELNAILNWLQPRANAFTSLQVSNFTLVPATITAQIAVLRGYSFASVSTEVQYAINLFLSPWIATTQLQLAPGKKLTASGIATVIKNVPGVREVQNISFNVSSADITNGFILASSLDHIITPYNI